MNEGYAMLNPRHRPPPTRADLEPARELALRIGLRQRDRAALEAVFRLYWPRLLAQARLLLPHDMDPEDAAAQVMLHLVRWAGSFDTNRAIYPWLARICLKVCGRRRRWHDRADMLERAHADTHGRRLATAEEEPATERDLRVARALDRLPGRCREVIALRYMFGLQTGEIGELLSLDPDSVTRTLYRGLDALRTGPDADVLKEWIDTWGNKP
jgi:RNA polymerase sigma-70 factor, ECF subfamily